MKESSMDAVWKQERLGLLDMLRAMLAFILEERQTTSSLITCEWMSK